MLDRPPSNRSFRDPDAPSAPASPDSAWRRFRRLALAQDASPDRLRRIVHAAPLSGFGQLLGFAVMTTYMADKAPAGLVSAKAVRRSPRVYRSSRAALYTPPHEHARC